MILSFLPLTNQKAGEIMSELMDEFVVVPMATCWSCHQNPSSRIQFLLSLFENRAISVQPFCSPMSQYTFKRTLKRKKIKAIILKFIQIEGELLNAEGAQTYRYDLENLVIHRAKRYCRHVIVRTYVHP